MSEYTYKIVEVLCANGEPGCFGYEVYKDGKFLYTQGIYLSRDAAEKAAKEEIEKLNPSPYNPLKNKKA